MAKADYQAMANIPFGQSHPNLHPLSNAAADHIIVIAAETGKDA